MQQAKNNNYNESPQILITDDDAAVDITLHAALTEAGYAVLRAESGEDAIRLCADCTPQLALINIQMNGLSGIETARILNQRHGIPFIFISENHDKVIIHNALQEGAMGYLVKPVEIPQLLPAIETALRRSADLRTLYSQNKNLETALNRNRDVSVAVGIIVTHSSLSATEAEHVLRQYARKHRIRMADIAQHVIDRANELNHLIGMITKS